MSLGLIADLHTNVHLHVLHLVGLLEHYVWFNHNCFSLLHRQKLIAFPWKISSCSSVKRGNEERYLSCILHKKITKCPSHWVKTDLAIHRAERTNSAVTTLQKRTVENSEVSSSFNSDHFINKWMLPSWTCAQASGNRWRKTSPNKPPTAKLKSNFRWSAVTGR